MRDAETKICLTESEAAALYGVSRRTFQRMRAADPANFPKPVELASRSFRFIRTELEAYLVKRPRVALGDEPPQLSAGRAARAAGLPPIAAAFSPAALGQVQA